MEFLFNNLRDHLAKQGFPSELLQGGVGGGFGGGGYRFETNSHSFSTQLLI